MKKLVCEKCGSDVVDVWVEFCGSARWNQDESYSCGFEERDVDCEYESYGDAECHDCGHEWSIRLDEYRVDGEIDEDKVEYEDCQSCGAENGWVWLDRENKDGYCQKCGAER